MSIVETASPDAAPAQAHLGHLVLLTNFIPPYAAPVLTELAQRVRKLTILISTPMESNRNWQPDWGSLNVIVQKALTFKRPWKHPLRFSDTLHVHVPYDTLSLLKSLCPDAIITDEFGIRSLLSTLYKGKTGRPPLVLWAMLSEQTELGRGWLRHRLRRFITRRVDCFATNGRSGARYLQSLGAEPQRIVRVSTTTLPDIFERHPVERPAEIAHRLLYVGSLTERKGIVPFVQRLIACAARRPDRRIEFFLAGAGPLHDELAALPVPANLSIRLLGNLRYSELPACYANAGILAFPTLSDEWGLVVNEGMAAGLPVLGSRYSQAVEELCEDGHTGWLFRPDHPEEMERAIERALATTPHQLDAMRFRARERVASINPEYVADRLVEALEIAVRRRSELSGAW